ncbi:MAG: very short patch repair endonuclease [Phycisphaerae bacterium]
MDTLSQTERSRVMSLVKSKDTRPERLVRSVIHRMGYRYRLHVRDLPGCPDIVFPSRKKVILVHGCFWHQHNCRMGRRMPKSRRTFWQRKLEGNKQRDRCQRRKLRRRGWQVLTVWECQLLPNQLDATLRRISDFLEG